MKKLKKKLKYIYIKADENETTSFHNLCNDWSKRNLKKKDI